MARTFHVAVNLLHTPAALTGTGHYARELIRAMLAAHPRLRITGFVTADNRAAFNIGTDAGRFRRVVWGRAWGSVMMRRTEEMLYLHRAIAAARPDVFWGPSNFLPPIVPRTARGRVPMVATIHDMTFFRLPESIGAVRRHYWQQWTRRTIAVADEILTVSYAARHDILTYGHASADRITVAYNGAGESFFVARDAPGRAARAQRLRAAIPRLPARYIVFVGTLTPHKNVPRLIDALAVARRHAPGATLVLAGKRGAEYHEIAERIARHRLGDAVVELGYVADEWLPALMENATALVLPSMNEGFGLPIVEAMAAGTPALTSREGATGEVGGDAALLFDPRDAREMAEAITGVWNDPELCVELRARGLARVEHFTWAAAARRTLDVLERAASAG